MDACEVLHQKIDRKKDLTQQIKNILVSTQPFRFLGKSIRNIFLPYVAKKVEPSELFVELTSICNAECMFCSYRFGHRTKSKMPLDKYSAIMQSGFEMGYRRLSLTPMGGELFVYDKAIDAIEMARDIGYETIETYTNGILLHKFDLKRLLRSGISTIKISFPGFDRQIYREVYGVDRFDEFVKSISMLLEAHKSVDSKVKIVLEPRSPMPLGSLLASEFYVEKIKPYITQIVYMNKPIFRYDTWGEGPKQRCCLAA